MHELHFIKNKQKSHSIFQTAFYIHTAVRNTKAFVISFYTALTVIAKSID